MGFIHPQKLILCCADMDARPLFWTTAGGGRDGYEPGAAALVAGVLGRELVWAFRRWDRFRPALEAGEADAIWCGSAITAERRRVFDYSRPYAAFDEAVLVRADSPAAGPADLSGLRVGAIDGSTNMRLAESFTGARLRGFDGSSDDVFAEMVEALRAGEIDALVDDEPAFGGLEAGGEFRVAFVAPTANPWGAAIRKGNAEVREALDRGLARVIGDGRLAALWGRFFPRKPFPLETDRGPA